MDEAQFFFLVFLLVFDPVKLEASVHSYNRETFRETGNAYLLSGGSEGMFAGLMSRDDARPIKTNDGRSFIRFENITFWRTQEAANLHSSLEHQTGLVQTVVFEAVDRDNIGGSAYGGQRSICCTPDLAKLEGCKQGEVLRRSSAGDATWPFMTNTYFNGDSLTARMDSINIYITKTGMYNLFFISCDANLKGLLMSGRTVWKNPYGFLPGRMAPLMKFYLFMSLAYLMLSIVWSFQYIRYWKEILQLQHCITTLVVLGLCEVFLWYVEYTHLNFSGTRPLSITACVVTLGAVRKTVSRLIVLSLSMGYGVVRPTLGGLTSKVLLIGLTYFLALEMLDIAENMGTISDFSGKARLLLVLPIAFLDAFLILWIFISLSKTLEKLQARRSMVKLDIYRKFTNALALAVLASVAWIVFEIYFKATDPFSERWRSAWLITAFWDVLALSLLCIICYLWAPSQNSQRYAYSDELGDETEEELRHLTKGSSEGEVSLVKQEKELDICQGGFSSLDDQAEEDKRE